MYFVYAITIDGDDYIALGIYSSSKMGGNVVEFLEIDGYIHRSLLSSIDIKL